MEHTSSLGFIHFLSQSDFIGKAIFAILVIMSVLSWSLILYKGMLLFRRRAASRAFLAFFWNATSLEAVSHEILTHGIRCPFSHLTAHASHAKEHHQHYGATKLSEAGTQQEFITRTMRMVIDEDAAKLENGLTILATIGSTAPFIGLFGTVYGIYNALLTIGATGSGSLDSVAGPVGEALIMTGIGLAVAIPAVIGYNWLVRSNNVLLSRLDSFANELLTFLTTGMPFGITRQAASESHDTILSFRRKG